jgi:hypothetical protein
MAPHPPDPIGLPLTAMLATVVVTLALSMLVVCRQRRVVRRSLRTRVPGAPAAVVPVPIGGGPAPGYKRARPAPVVVLDAAQRHAPNGPADDLSRRARRRLHGTVAAYVVAGLAVGLVEGAVWLGAGRADIEPRDLLGLAVLFAWPLLPTVLTIVAAPRPARVAAWAGYGVLVPLLMIGTGVTPTETAALVGGVVAPPVVVLFALSGRGVRAVGPFLVVPVLVTATGLLLYPWAAQWAVRLGASAEVGAVLAALGAGALGITGAAHLMRGVRRYARKRAGDQMVTISQWWLFATAWHSVVLIPAGVRPALAVWTAHLVFLLVLATALRLRPRPSDLPRRLLLLRPLGAQRHRDALLHRLDAHWRHIGTVATVPEPGLASAALEPHEFLDLLRGRPSRRIVETSGELRYRAAEFDQDPDPDGRYRAGELFCRDDLRREALWVLLRRTDCVLLDLRGYARGHAWATDEIARLAELAPLGRVVVLVDDETDQYALRATFDRARTAENRADGALRLLRARDGRIDLATVLDQLAVDGPRAV